MANKKTKLVQTIKKVLLYTCLFFVVGTSCLVLLLGLIPINSSSFMLQQHLTDFYDDKGFISIKQDWVSKEDISPYMFSAVVASEDQLFYQHHGFDIDSILSVLKNKSSGKKIRGASTISQQVAKNLFLTPSRSIWRKGLEAWFTILMELFWSKDRIVLVYVNIAQFGDHLFGVEAASQHYFSVPAKSITPEQAALLAASLPNPILFKVDRPSNYMISKQQWILRQMKNLSFL